MIIICSKCTYLFCLRHLQPMCVATAIPIPGPLRSLVDIKSVALAELRNRFNNCSLFQRRFLIDDMRRYKAGWIKKRLIMIMKLKGLNPEPVSLKGYTIGQERQRQQETTRLRNRGCEAGEEAEQRSQESRRFERVEIESPEGLPSPGPSAPNPTPSEERFDEGVEGDTINEEVDSGDGNGDDILGLEASGGGERDDNS
jgi:hypothetical protein